MADYEVKKDTTKPTVKVSQKELAWCEKQMEELKKQALVACVKLDYDATAKKYGAEYLLNSGISEEVDLGELSYNCITKLVQLIEFAEVHQAYMELRPRMALVGCAGKEQAKVFVADGVLATTDGYHCNWLDYNRLLDKLCGLELIHSFSGLRTDLHRLKWEMILPSMTDICKRADGVKTRLELFVEVNYCEHQPTKGGNVGLPGRRESPKSTHLYPFNLDGFKELQKDIKEMSGKLKDR